MFSSYLTHYVAVWPTTPPCLSSSAGEWSAQDDPVVITLWLSTPGYNHFTSCLFICTCWLYVCCYSWFHKLVLRGTLSPGMWRWPLGHHLWWKTAKPSFDWFPLCHWVSDSIELHLEVKARGWSRGFAAEQRLFATQWTLNPNTRWRVAVLTVGDKMAEENSLTKYWECLWLTMIFTCTHTPSPYTHHKQIITAAAAMLQWIIP